MAIGDIWDLIILNPMINVLITLSEYLADNFGMTIIVLTIIINIVMYPLTKKQLKASKAMQEIQSQVSEIRKKYAKDKQKASQEQMRLMKESGASYAGCLLPMLVQMPVWIVLYQSIIRVVAVAPEDFLNLSQRLYSAWPSVFSQVPLDRSFLWLDLAVSDTFLAVLVGASMWVQQKMTTPITSDPQQRTQGQMMQVMMPLMFAFISMSFPSGLALYWATSTVIRIIMQYYATGWGGLIPTKDGRAGTKEKEYKGRTIKEKKALTEDDTSADIVIEPSTARGEETDDGQSGDQREDSRGSRPGGTGPVRRQSGGSRSNRRKRG
ncbi:MAG: YidC/Oxa1 family membrane protein insertase [Dehalococcoidales bacterium]